MSLQSLFIEVAPKSFFVELCRKHGLSGRKGIYTTDVVIWMMMRQHLGGKATLSAAVQALAAEQPKVLGDCKRVREGAIASGTSSYSEARKKLPNELVVEVTDPLFQQLEHLMQEGWKGLKRPIFIVDGTTCRLQSGASLRKNFPAGRNQHGNNHWPMLRVVGFHEAFSGVAMRPNWGPLYGKRAVSEQALAIARLGHLPADAVVLGDINFGIFRFAWHVRHSGRAMIVRLQLARARKLLQQEPRAGMDQAVAWTPSRADRKGLPGLAEDAHVPGRVLVFQHPHKVQERICVFTDLDLPAEEILSIYGLRWNIEGDLRTLKQTLELQQLSSKSVGMMEKELLMVLSAYNLVRAAICLAARQAQLEPRQLSFSQAQDVVLAALPNLERAENDEDFTVQIERMLHRIARCKLPQRRKPRTYPRRIWGRGGKFPTRRRRRKTAPKRL